MSARSARSARSPLEWGPHFWGTLHTAAFSSSEFPNEPQRVEMYNFLYAFASVIPCVTCASHFQNMLYTAIPSPHSPILNSRKSLCQWTIDVHNSVNQKLGKRVWKYGEVAQWYEGDEDEEEDQEDTNVNVGGQTAKMSIQLTIFLGTLITLVAGMAVGSCWVTRREKQ